MMTNHEVVPLHEEARIEAALRYEDSEYQAAFAEGYERAMILAARRANSRADEPNPLAEKEAHRERLRERLTGVTSVMRGADEPNPRLSLSEATRIARRPYTMQEEIEQMQELNALNREARKA